MRHSEVVDDLEQAVALIFARCGADLRAAAPLGLGKPNRLLNAVYRQVKADPQRSMTLYTALSLARPSPPPGLAARFAGPFIERHFGADYPDLEYVNDLKGPGLPPNVRIHEFYLQSGAWLANAAVQRNYASINYTHVARDLAERGINLLLQLVARRGDRLSLACNADVTLDLLERIEAAGQPRPLVVFVVHPQMPFIGHDAELPLDFPDLLLSSDGPEYRLFALPRGAVDPAEFALGFNASALVRDGGTLQIGIGALSDALVHALLLRQRDNPAWASAVAALNPDHGALIDAVGGRASFAKGLYGASELVMDGFMHLRRAGILRRRVFDDLALQRALNDGLVAEVCAPDTLDRLLEAGLIDNPLTRPNLDWLLRFGLLPEGTQLHDGQLRFADGAVLESDLADGANRKQLARRIVGRTLRGGRWLHGAFFLGSHALYDWLRGLEGDDFEGLSMTRVSDINELYGGREALDVAQRHGARFFNTCMMHTLLGAAISDGLEDGRVVSGVGGQYNFVAMAHALPDARSVLMLRATREVKGELSSSILWHYGHCTIPRHLRDLVVTEYGIADLRGQHDEAVIERLLAISDARFIDALAAQAKSAGKLRADFVLPDAWRGNQPQRLIAALGPLKARGALDPYPFGSEFDATEQRLVGALTQLKESTARPAGKARALVAGILRGAPGTDVEAELARMQLSRPAQWRDTMQARILSAALRQSPGPGG